MVSFATKHVRMKKSESGYPKERAVEAHGNDSCETRIGTFRLIGCKVVGINSQVDIHLGATVRSL